MHKYKSYQDDKTSQCNLLGFYCCQGYKCHDKLVIVCWEHTAAEACVDIVVIEIFNYIRFAADEDNIVRSLTHI